jgi:hypothetical protein
VAGGGEAVSETCTVCVCMLWDVASNTVLSEGVGDSENSDIWGGLVYVVEGDACLDFEVHQEKVR